MKRLLFILGGIAFSFSPVNAQNSDSKPIISLQSIDEPVVEPLNWNYLTAKYDFDAELSNSIEKGSEEVSGTISIRLRKDSIMWFTVSASIGIQVMKGIIRSDSAFILDNFNKKAYLMSLEDLNKINDLPANLSAIQKLFTGELLTNKLVRDKSSDFALQNSTQSCFSGVDAQFVNYSVVLNEEQVSGFQLRKSERNTVLNAFFPNREQTELGKHPTEIKMDVKSDLSKVRLNLSLKTVRFEFIPSYPFFIPKDYERVDLSKI
jgi:hypothetical protein